MLHSLKSFKCMWAVIDHLTDGTTKENRATSPVPKNRSQTSSLVNSTLRSEEAMITEGHANTNSFDQILEWSRG